MRRCALPLLVCIAACGSSRPQVQPTSEFTDRHAALFEDGVDFVADPEKLGGQWRKDWSTELDHRVRGADMVAVVTVHTVRSDIDLEQRTTYRLLAEIDRVLLGPAPGDELSLMVREGDAGFGTVEGNDERILNQPFIAFVKWYLTASGEVAPHWHLAPATEPVLARTKWLLENRRDEPQDEPGRRHIVVHDD